MTRSSLDGLIGLCGLTIIGTSVSRLVIGTSTWTFVIIIAAVFILTAALIARLITPTGEDASAPAAAPIRPAVPPPGSAARTILDPDGGSSRAQAATFQAMASTGMPGALTLVRVEPRPDGDAEVHLMLAGITPTEAASLIANRLLHVWGVRGVRGFGTSRDNLFQVTVTNG